MQEVGFEMPIDQAENQRDYSKYLILLVLGQREMRYFIRTHDDFEFYDKNKSKHFFLAMVSLGIVTGMPEAAGSVFAAMKRYGEDVLFEQFLNEETDEQLRSHYDKLIKVQIVACQDTTLGKIELKYFLKNLKLISRFSFRNI